MSDTILAALLALTGMASFALGFLLSLRSGGKLVQFRLEQLERKEAFYNKVADRVYRLEVRAGLRDETLKRAGQRLDVLERERL